MKNHLWTGLSVFAVAGVLGGLAQAGEAELILHGGKIVTGDAAFSTPAALAVKDGRILAAGFDDEILKLKGAQTALLDLRGRTVIPGLIDSHVHPGNASTLEYDHPIPDMESIADVLAYLEARAKVVPAGEWLILRQVFITRLKEQRYPTRAELDRAAPKHPVLFATGPDASLNTLALQASGIDRDFKVSDGGPGFIEKDAAGEATGILRNCTRFVKSKPHGRQPTEAQRRARLLELLRDYASVGITGIVDRDCSPAALELYKSLREKNELPVRVGASCSLAYLGSLEQMRERVRDVARNPLCKREDSWLRILGVKTYLDGGMLTGSAYMRQPWGVSGIYAITDPQYRGVRFIDDARLRAMVRAAVESNLQFTAHSVGDGAVHALLEVYAELHREMPEKLRATRPCLTHANFLSREAIELAARVGAVMDIQPAWLYLDSPTLTKQFGLERLRYFQPLKSLFAAGVTAGGGSDHMQKIGSLRSINPYNPFLGMATAVTRRARGGDAPFHPEEALTREQALRFYTSNNAYLLFAENELGSLEPGKRADFAILDTDILNCPEDAIARTKVIATYVDGRKVFGE